MIRKSPPTRTLRARPDLDQLKRQAKELMHAFVAGDAGAVAEVSAHYRNADPGTFALHDAQLVLARAYGLDSWPKLKAYVDGVTIARLVDAVRSHNLAEVRAMLEVRPELAQMSADNLQLLHHAVLNRAADMVRLLMAYGAHAREGVYPHRDATSPLTIATERGYEDIVAIIREEEQRLRKATIGSRGAPEPDDLFKAIASGDDLKAIGMIDANPALVHSCHPVFFFTPLHLAADRLNHSLVTWLLDHGADANQPARNGWTPLDAAASRVARSGVGHRERFTAVAGLLQHHGAVLTDRAAVALGEVDWIRARHAERALAEPIDGSPGGLLRIAVTHDRPEMLALLLDFGLDPDERVRVGGVDAVEYSWGFPLWECAATGKHAMAEMLLDRGADPNAQVYASGSPFPKRMVSATGR